MNTLALTDSPSPPLKQTQVLLRDLAAQAGPEGMDYKTALAGMDRRGFAPFILFAAALLILPIDFALPQIAGLTLVVCGLGLFTGAAAPWMPGFVAKMRAKKTTLEGLAAFFESQGWSHLILTPRHPEYSTGVGERMAALALIALGIETLAPLPNMIPALGALALGLGLVQRDGLVMLIGIAVTIGWTAFLIAMAVGAHFAAPFASGWMNDHAAWAMHYLAPVAPPVSEPRPHSPS